VCSSYGVCLHVSLPYLTVWEVSYASLPPSSYRILTPRSVTESYGAFCVHSSLLRYLPLRYSYVRSFLGTVLTESTVFLLSLRYSSS
jgi:hypothetical protein